MKDFSLLIDFYMNKSLENKDIFYNYVGGSSRLLFNRVSIITVFMLILGCINPFLTLFSLCYLGYLLYLIYCKFIKRRSFNKQVKFINQKLVSLVETNGFVDKKIIEGVTHIIYYPKIWFSIINESDITITFKLDGSRYQDKYLELEDKLYHLLGCRVKDVIVERGYIIYKLTSKELRPYILDSSCEGKILKCAGDDFIKFNDDLVWNFRSNPHALLTGVTGGGKTYMLFFIIRNLLSYGADVKIIDPKMIDLDFIKKYLGESNVVNSVGNGIRILRECSKIIDNRNLTFQNSEKYKSGADYKHYGYNPIFIIFDEVTSFFAACDDKQKKEANSYLQQIIMRGRSAGLYMVMTAQRGDAKVISGDIRDQLGLRLSLGQLSADGYVMTFGNEYRDLKHTMTSLVKPGTYSGVGFAYIPGVTNKPMEYYSPILDNTYSFANDIEKLVGVNIN